LTLSQAAAANKKVLRREKQMTMAQMIGKERAFGIFTKSSVKKRENVSLLPRRRLFPINRARRANKERAEMTRI
jgi:hypothetical protein